MKTMKTGFLAVLFLAALVPAARAQGTLSGRVTFEGAAPAVETTDVKLDSAVCGEHKAVPKIILGEKGGVANAVVRILGLKGTAAPAKGDLDQVHCEFVPHVQALPTGSTLVITSSDSVLHNTHAFNEAKGTVFNVAVPIPGAEVKRKLDKPGVLKLRCDAGHTWMSAYVVVSDEPFAVTDANGNFTIENLPAGRYEAEVWQEWLGKSTRTVEIKEGSNETAFVLKENR
ncbi:MAG TPA: hypothetical protein VL404_09400 [Candidatus Eisenbacteria bacterium]|jgi:hypothetical protein|nr:hypothetical protein [Candidatus Eisenbacteria bacterium]